MNTGPISQYDSPILGITSEGVNELHIHFIDEPKTKEHDARVRIWRSTDPGDVFKVVSSDWMYEIMPMINEVFGDFFVIGSPTDDEGRIVCERCLKEAAERG